jgi:hypothetical protein
MSWSLERLITGGDVTGECDARTPGSDGASPYPENVPNVPEKIEAPTIAH